MFSSDLIQLRTLCRLNLLGFAVLRELLQEDKLTNAWFALCNCCCSPAIVFVSLQLPETVAVAVDVRLSVLSGELFFVFYNCLFSNLALYCVTRTFSPAGRPR